jgi:tetratricopeptide (TPR) repeat protein
MMITFRNIFLFFLIALLSASCNFMEYKNKPQDISDININEWNEEKKSNLKPMYGNIERTKEQKSADKEFIDEMLEDYKDKEISAKKLASKGWYYFFHNKIDTAMFRFNQCWLMDSAYAESYFGFAAIREYQGLKKESDVFYLLAYKHDNSDSLSKKILNKIADIKEKQKDTIPMLNAFHRAYNKFPDNAIASGKLAYFYSVLNKPDSSLKYYNITIHLDPDYFQRRK